MRSRILALTALFALIVLAASTHVHAHHAGAAGSEICVACSAVGDGDDLITDASSEADLSECTGSHAAEPCEASPATCDPALEPVRGPPSVTE